VAWLPVTPFADDYGSPARPWSGRAFCTPESSYRRRDQRGAPPAIVAGDVANANREKPWGRFAELSDRRRSRALLLERQDLAHFHRAESNTRTSVYGGEPCVGDRWRPML